MKFNTDTVILIKANGEEFPNIKATVQSHFIFTNDAKLPIEEGDHFIRTLPNGLKESYLVIDRGFYERVQLRPAHYQCKVRKESSIPFKESQSNITYNLHGPNSRVNNNSVDNSTNTVTITTQNVFDELKKAIELEVESANERKILIKSVDEMEVAQGTPSYISKYQSFMANASNHITVLSSFIPALTKLLS